MPHNLKSIVKILLRVLCVEKRLSYKQDTNKQKELGTGI